MKVRNLEGVQPRALRMRTICSKSGFVSTAGHTSFLRKMLHPNSSPVHCRAKKGVGSILRDAVSAPSGQHNLALLAGGNFLRTLGIENNIEITRIMDICTNPNSIFGTKRGQPVNPYARKLTVEEMQVIVGFFVSMGASREDIARIVMAFPQVLCYSAEDRVKPFFAYLTEDLGLSTKQAVQLLARRPLLLGLAQENVRRMVDFLSANGSCMEEYHVLGHEYARDRGQTERFAIHPLVLYHSNQNYEA